MTEPKLPRNPTPIDGRGYRPPAPKRKLRDKLKRDKLKLPKDLRGK